MASIMQTGGQPVATDETMGLIAASNGSIYDVMIDKQSGEVAYAVMSFGRFLGMGQEYHPLPWSVLTYDTDQGGYVVNLDKDKLEGAPCYTEDDAGRWDDPEYTRGIDDYYARFALQGRMQ